MPKPCPSCPSSWLRASAVSGTCPLPLVACTSSETLPGCPLRSCVCVACLCVSGTRVWATRSPDVTQGMPAVEGDDCRGQVGLRTQGWGSPWGWEQGGSLCWQGAVASASGPRSPPASPSSGPLPVSGGPGGQGSPQSGACALFILE